GSYKTASIVASTDLAFVETAELSFDYHMYGSYIDYLALDVFNGSEWINDVWIMDRPQHSSSEDEWSSAVVDLSAFVGSSDVSLRFRTANTLWNAADAAIDNIRVRGTGGPILVGYDFDGGVATPSVVLSPFLSASEVSSPMDVAFSATIGDESGVDAEGLSFGHVSKRGGVAIAVDDATTASFENAVTGEDYLTFTVTPEDRVSLNLEAITFKAAIRVAESVDEYAVTDEDGNLLGESVTITTTGLNTTYQSVSVDLSGTEFQNLREPTTFRIYAWGSETSSPWGTVAAMDKITLHGGFDFNETPVAT
ncbi:MAG: hypothetical protein ACQKBU_00285, partial [Verrucomicrobiales bacterium]